MADKCRNFSPINDTPFLEWTHNKNVTNKDITGFEGSNLAGKIDMKKNFVNGVSTKIKEYNN